MTHVVKNVLGIHGMSSFINSNGWIKRINKFNDNGMNLILFQFDVSEDPTYESWESTFNKIDFGKYDVVYTSSFGGKATIRYLYDNNINVKRLVMSVPGKSVNTINGKYKNAQKILNYFENKDFSTIADEIIVISTKDDDVVPYKSGKEIANITKADFVLLETGGHKLEGHLDLIVDLVKNGKMEYK